MGTATVGTFHFSIQAKPSSCTPSEHGFQAAPFDRSRRNSNGQGVQPQVFEPLPAGVGRHRPGRSTVPGWRSARTDGQSPGQSSRQRILAGSPRISASRARPATSTTRSSMNGEISTHRTLHREVVGTNSSSLAASRHLDVPRQRTHGRRQRGRERHADQEAAGYPLYPQDHAVFAQKHLIALSPRNRGATCRS